ncbi:FtsX-like permease family protein [Microcella sp.]|uniref:ABC transporter permease n=1 Tax=Microcella sp. TaxID=1913979 RepID=UPI002569DA54|nr:FtsX-like permease family protein [Microcella sp.]MBX9471670.1 hypothetical protein [Microcella sp.]
MATGLVVATGSLLDHRADEGVQGEFAGLSGDDRALRLSLPLAADAVEQDAVVRAAIADDFARATAGISIDRSVEGRMELTLEGDDSFSGPIEALSVPDIEARADLVAGTWSGASGITMQADAAAALGIKPGAIVALNGEPFEMTGTWRVRDALDPRWTDSVLVTHGAARERAAVVLIDEAVLGRLAAEPQATWSVVPDSRALTVADLSTMPRAWSLLSGSLREGLGAVEGLERRGGFVDTAREIEVSVLGLAAVEPVVLVLIAVLALATLARLTRLLALDRETEWRLRWSRGASVGALSASASIEAMVIGVVGAAIGATGAVWLLIVDGVPVDMLPWAEAATVGTISCLTAVVFAAVASWQLVRRFDADRGALSMRGTRTAGLGIVILVSAAAAVSTWQLLLYGSPLIPDAGGQLSVDPVPVAAPALLLIASVLVVSVIAPVVGRVLDNRRRGSTVIGALAVTNIARRPDVATASVVMSAIAVSVIVFAAAYAGTWVLAFDRSAQSRAGSDLSAIVPDGISTVGIDAVGDLSGVDGIAPLHVESIQIGGELATLVAVAPDALAALVAPSTVGDPSALAEQLRVESPEPVLPEGSERLELTVAVSGFTVTPTITLQLADAFGVVREVAVPIDPDRADSAGSVVYAVDLPPGVVSAPGPLRVVAIDAAIADAALPFGVVGVWELLSLNSTGAAGSSDIEIEFFWSPLSAGPRFDQPLSSPEARGFVVESSGRTVRLAPRLLIGDPPPIVLSQSLAESTATTVGDVISLRSVGIAGPFTARVIAVIDAVPSAPEPLALLIDLALVRSLQYTATEPVPPVRQLWISTDNPSATAEAARALLPAGSRFNDATEQPLRSALGAAVVALWLTAAGSAVLALVVIGASVRAQHRSRRPEVAVLRALGLRAWRQGALRLSENVLATTIGVLGGVVAGAATVSLAVVPFARSALPADVPLAATPLAVDGSTGAIGIAGLVLGLAVVALGAALRVSRDARSANAAEFDR